VLLLVGASAAAGDYRSTVLSDGPVGYWRLGEATGTVAADETRQNDGAYRGDVGLGAPGALGGVPNTAINLGGADQGVDVADAPRLDGGLNDIAVEAWVKTTANAEQVVVTKDAYVAEPSWQLSVTDDDGLIGRPRMKVFDGTSDQYAYGPSRVDDGNWHHVVVDVDRDVGITIYVDGGSATTRILTPGAFESSGNLLIGHARDIHYPDFRGTLDEIALYPRLLGQTEVEHHFRLGSDRTAPSVALTSPAAGSRTNDPTPTFAGNAGVEAYDLPTVVVNIYAGGSTGTPLASLTGSIAADGSFSVTPPAALADGTYTAQAEQLDEAGNIARSSGAPFVVDTRAPAPTITSPADKSVSARATPDFRGSAGTAEGDRSKVTVTVFRGSTAVGTPVQTLNSDVAPDGTFSARAAALADGTYTARAEQSDAAGNTGWSKPATFNVTASGYAAEVEADAPAAYWRLGEANGPVARDEIGQNPGTYVGEVALGRNGAIAGDRDTAASFAGAGAGVVVADGPGLDAGAGDFAVEAWVKTSVSGEQAIVGKDDDRGWVLTVTDDPNLQGRPRLKVFDGVSPRYAYGPERVDDGSWHHVVADVDRDSGITVYVDAAPSSTPLLSAQPLETAADLEIGRAGEHPNFVGEVDEVAVYPRLLVRARVNAHYQAAHAAGDPAGVVWSADMETGDLSQWTRDGTHGGSYDSGACLRPPSGVSTEAAHSGNFAMKMTVDLGIGDAGCRQFRHEESLTGETFYYGAWFYLPAYVAAVDYWNVFQFKSETATLNDPFWILDLMPRSDGALHLRLRWKGAVVGPFSGDTTTGTKNYDQTKLTVPVGRWFHIEAYLKQAADFSGRLTIWQDGVQLYDMVDVKTKYAGGDERWSVNNYSNGLLPTLATLYVDDATVATRRVGP
jgi:hypothetical protein